jgi:hypothetical protein
MTALAPLPTRCCSGSSAGAFLPVDAPLIASSRRQLVLSIRSLHSLAEEREA